MVTDCAELYVPAAGLKAGVATTGRLMVYTAEPTALLVSPLCVARAFNVSVAETAIAEL